MLLLKMSKRAWAGQPEIRELWPSVSGKVIYPKCYTNFNESCNFFWCRLGNHGSTKIIWPSKYVHTILFEIRITLSVQGFLDGQKITDSNLAFQAFEGFIGT